jgi:hypothetical protein
MSAQHTPGPWAVITEDHDISVEGEGWFEDQHVNGWMVVGNPDNPEMAIAVLDTGWKNCWRDEALDANAALIAAAPDMLAALQRFLEADGNPFSAAIAYAYAEEAVAKATNSHAGAPQAHPGSGTVRASDTGAVSRPHTGATE